MAIRWSVEGYEHTGRDLSGKIVARITPRRVGEPIKWTVIPSGGGRITTGMANTMRGAKSFAESAYVRLST